MQILAATMKILLLDDNKMNNLLLGRVLKALGFSSVSFTKSQEALDQIAAERAKGDAFDVLFCDVIMPGNLNGDDVIKRIRASEKPKGQSLNPLAKLDHPLTIVSLTSMASAKSETMIRDLGADFFITKPINKFVLEKLMKEVTGKLAKN
ncbi:MAG: response regulator [SAR324 cluster bacterium]|nr:response regulator [SAR324 cluster bacterium]